MKYVFKYTLIILIVLLQLKYDYEYVKLFEVL